MADEKQYAPVKLPLFSPAQEAAGEIELSGRVFGHEGNAALLHEAVRMQMANRRAGTASTKTRGLISGGGKKPYRQKGTGNARAGSIRSPIWRKGGTIFTGDPAYQVTQDFPSWEVFPVLKLDDARKAIRFIVFQGEGTPSSPSDPLAGGELAHYYRFGEIVHGRALVPDGKVPPSWSYTGDLIPFDPSTVAPVIANPKTAGYPAGSAARYGCQTFNYTYTSLLKVLHEAFNGNPSRLSAAIGMMESLKEQALTLATIDSGDGGKAGPSFEYQPTNP